MTRIPDAPQPGPQRRGELARGATPGVVGQLRERERVPLQIAKNERVTTRAYVGRDTRVIGEAKSSRWSGWVSAGGDLGQDSGPGGQIPVHAPFCSHRSFCMASKHALLLTILLLSPGTVPMPRTPKDLDRLQGEWTMVSGRDDGVELVVDSPNGMRCTVRATKLVSCMTERWSKRLRSSLSPPERYGDRRDPGQQAGRAGHLPLGGGDVHALLRRIPGSGHPGDFAAKAGRVTNCWSGNGRLNEKGDSTSRTHYQSFEWIVRRPDSRVWELVGAGSNFRRECSEGKTKRGTGAWVNICRGFRLGN